MYTAISVLARQIGWMSQYGEKLDLPLNGEAKTTCPNTGITYRLKAGQVTSEE